MAAPKNYMGVPMPAWFHEEGAKAFRELELEADDVVLVSIPKTGTTWVNKILHCLLRMDESGSMPLAAPGSDLGASGQIYPDFLTLSMPEDPDWPGAGPGGLLGKCCIADLFSQPRPRLFSTHMLAELLPESLSRTGRLVYVLRNPKDTMTSLHYFRGEPKDGWTGNEHGAGTLERFLSGVNAYGSFFDHVVSMSQYMEGPCAGRAIVVYYEELHRDLKGGIASLAEFLQVPLSEEKLEAVYKLTTFDAMSKGSASKGVSAVLCRKGICGDWQNAPLTPEQWARVDTAFEERIGSNPLAQPLRPWMQAIPVNGPDPDATCTDPPGKNEDVEA